MKTKEPSPQVVPLKLNKATGEIEWTLEGLKMFRALYDDLTAHETRLDDGGL